MHRSSPFSLWPILISAQNHRALFLLQGMRRQKRRVDEQLAEKCTHGENCGFCGHTGHPDSACPKRKRFAEVAQQRVADSAEGFRPEDALAETSTHGETCGFCGRAGHPNSACPKRKRFAEVAQQRVADSAEGLESFTFRCTSSSLSSSCHSSWRGRDLPPQPHRDSTTDRMFSQ